MSLSQSIIEHILQDVIVFVEHNDFFVKNLDYLEDEKPISASVYSGNFGSETEKYDALLVNLEDAYLFQIDLKEQGIWILSGLDNQFEIIRFIEGNEYRCSFKEIAQFLLLWENLIDYGWSWYVYKNPDQKMLELLEKHLER